MTGRQIQVFGNFQRSLAISSTSLHTVAAVVVAAWILVGGKQGLAPDCHNILWQQLPDWIGGAGWFNSALAILTVALTVYTLGELNTSQVLLRLNSRAVSIVFAALILTATSLHSFSPGLVSMFVLLLSYFPLFTAYQTDNSAGLVYVACLYLGVSALAVPQTIWIAPIYILSLYILRAINAQSISGAILGIVTPFWITGGLAFCTGRTDGFLRLLAQTLEFDLSGYARLTAGEITVICLTALIFIISVADFYMRVYLDKTRTRCIFGLVTLHGFSYIILLLVHPAGYRDLMPAIIMNASVMGGHYVGNDPTPLSNITVCVITLFVLAAFILNSWIF